MSLDWWRASPDGTHVVYGLSKDGSEDSLLHVLTVADGQRSARDASPTPRAPIPHWLDDGSGFFYNQLTGAVATPERYLDSQARFHRWATDPESDPDPHEARSGRRSRVRQDPGALHRHLPGFALRDPAADRRAARGARVHRAARRCDRRQGASGQPFAGFEDEVTDFELDGDDLYLLVNKGTPRGRIVKTSAAAPSLADRHRRGAAGSAMVIEGTVRARATAFTCSIMDGGISRLRKLGRDGKVADIALPFDGTIGALFAVPERGRRPDFASRLAHPRRTSGRWTPPARVADTGITPKPAIDVSAYEAKRFFATAKDGIKIPYTLIYRKGLKLDGRNPTWISAYGSYGLPPTRRPSPARTLALVDAGAIVGYANVRGGGEYGREWHKAGQLANKPNTWRDLIAVCEELIAKKYTSSQHLAIGGRSAGGITVGRAMTERPDLFAAVIDGVGWSNPLRYVVEQDGYGEEPEWGAITDPAGYKALKSIDSYQAVKDGTAYPAVLLTTGVTDPRVAPFHVAKMTARLQAASTSGKPILLRVDYRRRPRHRLDARAAGPRSGRHLRVPAVADGRQGLPAGVRPARRRSLSAAARTPRAVRRSPCPASPCW